MPSLGDQGLEAECYEIYEGLTVLPKWWRRRVSDFPKVYIILLLVERGDKSFGIAGTGNWILCRRCDRLC